MILSVNRLPYLMGGIQMKKVLAFALVCLFALSAVLPCLAADAEVSKSVALGTWPQSMVTEKREIAALSAKLRLTNAQWQSAVLPDGSAVQFCDVGFLPYTDLATNRPSYRAVRIGTGAIQWYRWEPLTWQRTSYHGVHVWICTSVVTAAPYSGPNPVAKGDPRAAAISEWLTNDFYNTAFSDAEKADFMALALPLYGLTSGTTAAVGDYALLYGASGSDYLQMQDPELPEPDETDDPVFAADPQQQPTLPADGTDIVKGDAKTTPAPIKAQAKVSSDSNWIGVRPMLIGIQPFGGGLINFLRRLFGW